MPPMTSSKSLSGACADAAVTGDDGVVHEEAVVDDDRVDGNIVRLELMWLS